jgi:hypothetical protein
MCIIFITACLLLLTPFYWLAVYYGTSVSITHHVARTYTISSMIVAFLLRNLKLLII